MLCRAVPLLTAGGVTVATERYIGFRYAVVVTGNDTDPAYVANNYNVDGTDDQGMRIRYVCGAVVLRLLLVLVFPLTLITRSASTPTSAIGYGYGDNVYRGRRVNGAPLFVRGANMIPMDELEGRYDARAFRQVASRQSRDTAPHMCWCCV